MHCQFGGPLNQQYKPSITENTAKRFFDAVQIPLGLHTNGIQPKKVILFDIKRFNGTSGEISKNITRVRKSI